MESCKRCSAYAQLVKSLESQLLYWKAELETQRAVEKVNHEAIATLASERAANAQLTNELQRSEDKMEDLIKALQIFLKYGNPRNPTHCEHDVLYVAQGVHPEDMDKADVDAVEALSFCWDLETEAWQSFRFGSA